MTFEIYEDAAGEWRWRLVAKNGRIMADSGEGYASKPGCLVAVRRIHGLAATCRSHYWDRETGYFGII